MICISHSLYGLLALLSSQRVYGFLTGIVHTQHSDDTYIFLYMFVNFSPLFSLFFCHPTLVAMFNSHGNAHYTTPVGSIIDPGCSCSQGWLLHPLPSIACLPAVSREMESSNALFSLFWKTRNVFKGKDCQLR